MAGLSFRHSETLTTEKMETKKSGKKWFRMLENGEQYWTGKAFDPEHAEERAFWDEEPGSYPRYTLQRWDGKKWVNIYKDECLAPA
jgi:hypothetical protein